MAGRKRSTAGASKSKTEPTEEDPIVQLLKLLDGAGMRMTFDPKRNINNPCLDCGTTHEPRHLIDIGWDESRQDEITRPLCFRCAFKRGSSFSRSFSLRGKAPRVREGV
jgi:hypothetical protein